MDWDEYWLKAQGTRQPGLYEHVAAFYRRQIISRSAVRLLSRYFANEAGCRYLHAGCGSGGSDERLWLDAATVHALDFSYPALKMYEKQPRPVNRTFVCGDIFSLPYQDDTMDGIFNFGVMEHFVERDLTRSLTEFHRVLKPDGRVVLFWPPNFGLSVMVLTTGLWLINRFRKEPLKLYPDEVSRVKSFAWVRKLMTAHGFKVHKVHFGPADLFTFVIVVAQKV